MSRTKGVQLDAEDLENQVCLVFGAEWDFRGTAHVVKVLPPKGFLVSPYLTLAGSVPTTARLIEVDFFGELVRMLGPSVPRILKHFVAPEEDLFMDHLAADTVRDLFWLPSALARPRRG